MLTKESSDFKKNNVTINTAVIFPLQNGTINVHFWPLPEIHFRLQIYKKEDSEIAIGTCYLASTLYIMATLLTLEQHASNGKHLENNMLPELRTAKIVTDF